MLSLPSAWAPNRRHASSELTLGLILLGLAALTPNFGFRPPPGTRDTLLRLRYGLLEARHRAEATGRVVRVQVLETSQGWRFRACLAGLPESAPGAPLAEVPLPGARPGRCGLIRSAPDPSPAELAPAVAYGFGPGAPGWDQSLAGEGRYGFAPDGRTVLLTPEATAVPLPEGFWVGAAGAGPGAPCGVVLVSRPGLVTVLYKRDRWVRLE